MKRRANNWNLKRFGLSTLALAFLFTTTTVTSAQVDPQLLQVLTNFDITNQTGANVNDFEVWLNNISGTQILTNSTQPYTNAPALGLSGWTPASIATGTYAGNPQTIVRWGGIDATPVTPGSVVHFGVTLNSGAQPSLLCMQWSVDGAPVFTPGPSVSVVSNPPINGQVVVRTVNQPVNGDVCDIVVGTGIQQWVQRHVGVVDRNIELTELVLGSELLDSTELIDPDPVLQDVLAAMELPVTLSTISDSQAIVYWYTTFLDDAGTPGEPYSTMFYGYNYAVPEPSGFAGLLSGLISLAFFRRQRIA